MNIKKKLLIAVGIGVGSVMLDKKTGIVSRYYASHPPKPFLN